MAASSRTYLQLKETETRSISRLFSRVDFETPPLHKPETPGWPLPQRRATAGGMPGNAKREHQADRLAAIRLRYSINTHLDDRGVTTPADIARAVGLPAAKAVRLLQQW